MKRFFRLAVLLLTAWVCCILAACVGCTPATQEQAGEPAASPFNREPYDHVLILAVDESESFKDLMKPGGKGIEFANAAVEKYLSDRAGQNDYLVVTSMCGNFQSILWAGSPHTLREEFADIGVWAELLQRKADAKGSRIWDGLSDSLEMVMSDPTMWNSHTRVAVIAITDMQNNLVDNYTSQQRLETALKAFAKGGGVIGMYFVETQETIRWRQKLPTMGFKDFVVSPAAESKPHLPSFE